ncbi:Fic family protein [Nocardia mangyaensis]|uniref:Fic family protein n=1 Tax=Nocardia mangyaensis TaxID=2213200 RepID=UPI003084528A
MPEPAVLKAGLAHLWFVAIHPFDDGNGRIARALGDLALARSEHSHRRFYSLSAQIQRDLENYYAILGRTQRGNLDVTDWLLWFLDALHQSIINADTAIDAALAKASFWRTWHATAMNPARSTCSAGSWTASTEN